MQQYWTLIRLRPDGNHQPRELPAAKTFFDTEFKDAIDRENSTIQTQLLQNPDPLAQLCLRCYISHEIVNACNSLFYQYGQTYRFQVRELLSMVLGDDGRLNSSYPYPPLSLRILQDFNPKSGSLRNWVIRLVRQDENIREFLEEQGLHLITNWAILNDTSLSNLRRILTQFHGLATIEIEQNYHLLNSYQEIYREDRRRQKSRQRCIPPTDEQLDRIAQHLKESSNLVLTAQQVNSQLTSLALQLREYRIARRSGNNPQSRREFSLDVAETAEKLEYEISEQAPELDLEAQAIDRFMTAYSQQVFLTLEQSLSQVVEDRQRKQPKKAEAFIQALERFHCQGQSMTEIATAIGAKRQDEVSRLLKLRAFRADVRHLMLLQLKSYATSQAQLYNSPDQLQELDSTIDQAIGERLDTIMTAAEKEAATAKEHRTVSLFSDRLCHYLHQTPLKTP